MIEAKLKYPRRTQRTIDNQTFQLVAPTEKRSYTMSKIESKGTTIEYIFEEYLRLENINYTKPEFLIESLEGKPDFVIPKFKIVIFCDGEFWHGLNHSKDKIKTNTEFWNAKIEKNIKRDNEVNKILDSLGWTVLRFKESDIKKKPLDCINILKACIQEYLFENNSENYDFSFVDLFSGIGGFRIPLEELGGKCLGFSEIDREAVNVYKKNFIDCYNSKEKELGSVTGINKLPFEVDLITGGVPCQSWSVAGAKKGFDDPRGQLWFDSIRIVSINLPKAFIFENVKGLYDPRNRESLEYLLQEFDKIGYNVKYKLLNSYDFGVPQNRDRIFLVGLRKNIRLKKKFEFPEPIQEKPKLFDFIEAIPKIHNQKRKFTSKEIFGSSVPRSRNRCQKLDELNDFFTFCDTRNGHTTIHSWDITRTSSREKDICYVVLRNRRKSKYGKKDGNPLSFGNLKELIPDLKQQEIDKLVNKKILRHVENVGYEFVNSKNSSGINGIYRIYLPHSDIFSTLTATGTKDYIATDCIEETNPEEYKSRFIKDIFKKKKFKHISSRDAGNLQGFSKTFIYHQTESTAKKQFGNAVSVPVIYHLAKSLIETGIFK